MTIHHALLDELAKVYSIGEKFLQEVVAQLGEAEAAAFASSTTPQELEAALGAQWRGISYKLSTNERALRMLNRMLALGRPTSKGRALDVGSGYGGGLYGFHQLGFEPHGVEIDANLIALAHANLSDFGFPYHVSLRDVLSEGTDGLTFDLITLNDVIEHVADPVGAIAKLAKMLNPGGVLALYAPNGRSIFNAIADPHNRVFGASALPRSLAKPLVQATLNANGYGLGEYLSLAAFRNLAKVNNLTFRYEPTIWSERQDQAQDYLRDFLSGWASNDWAKPLGDPILAREVETALWRYVSDYSTAAAAALQAGDAEGFTHHYLARAWTITFKKAG